MATLLCPEVLRRAAAATKWNGLGDRINEGLEAGMAGVRALAENGNCTGKFYNNLHEQLTFKGLFAVVEQPTEFRESASARIAMESSVGDYFGPAEELEFEKEVQSLSSGVCTCPPSCFFICFLLVSLF